MCEYMKRLVLGCVCALGLVASAAVPEAVVTLAKQMEKSGAESRSGYTPQIGLFIVARGIAPIEGIKAKAKAIARANAVQNIAAFMSNQVSSKKRTQSSEATVNEETKQFDFFSSMNEVKIKELLKGVQDLSMEDDGEKFVATVYWTQKAASKSAELKAAMEAMGDEGTVRAVGEAKTYQNAVQMALRVAVEQVVGTMIVGETKITDKEETINEKSKSIQKFKSKIFSGAEGFVDTYRVVEEVEVSATWRVAVIAKVSKKKILDSYRVYLKTLGDPVFYLKCVSSDSQGEDKQVAARFGQFFRKLGFKISKTKEGADYLIKASGEYRRVQDPVNADRMYTQYSMVIQVISKTGEELLSLPNNPRKSSVCIDNPEREREICAEKAFKQMEKPVHEAINDMIARMMADHTDKLINSDE